MRRLVTWFKALSAVGKAGVVLAAFVGIGVVSAAGQPAAVSPPSKPAATITSQPTATTRTSTSTKPVAFSSTTVQDSSLAQGTSKVTTTGLDGVETLTYQDTYTNDKQTAHKLIGDEITTKPVAQVTSIGTYVAPAPSTLTCTNGTYVNSAGNTVCRPETSSTAPAGATAQCVDGTYSFSQSRSGTCSHHGGVAQWL